MWFILFPINHQYYFLGLAVAWSACQAYAGYWYGTYIFERANLCRKPHVRICAYGAHHAAFYFFCSLCGFTAWYVAGKVSAKIGVDHWSTIGGGTATILVALAVLTAVGISGALPRILYLGNRPV